MKDKELSNKELQRRAEPKEKTKETGKPSTSRIDYVLIGLLGLAVLVSLLNILLTLRIAASLGVSLSALLGL